MVSGVPRPERAKGVGGGRGRRGRGRRGRGRRGRRGEG